MFMKYWSDLKNLWTKKPLLLKYKKPCKNYCEIICWYSNKVRECEIVYFSGTLGYFYEHF